ncbi:MAG: VCBS repeat-containing protein [Acidobacteria bacterium]|nr:VCBS repeat-containing protein [Acidobacteriota bacterium]
MQRLKLFVLFLFACFAAVFYGIIPETNARAGTLTAPTGVQASDGDYADKIGVHWDTVRDAAVYRVYRNTVNDPATAVDVGTSPRNYLFDASGQQDTLYFYWVRAERPGTASPLSEPAQGRIAVGQVSPGTFPPLEPPLESPENPVTAAKASLGKALFWDEQLSSTRTVACGTCHRPAEGGSDPRTNVGSQATTNPGFDQIYGTEDDVFGSPGVPRNHLDGTYEASPQFGFAPQVTNRRALSYLNAGYSENGLFWDGRATDAFRDPLSDIILIPERASLESQILAPPVSDVEMAHIGRGWTQVVERIAGSKPLAVAVDIPASLTNWIDGRTYPQLFEEAFGTPEVTPARVAMAISSHERQLFSDRTPLDRRSSMIEPLTQQEQDGMDLFISMRCNVCHEGSLLTDDLYHNIAVRPQNEDRGRGAITNDPDDDAKFRTPSLRNVELRGPYMHNGAFETLEDVIEFYNRGGDHDAANVDHTLIRQMGMWPEDVEALAAFLKRPLTDPRVRDELPPFDRPKLFTESGNVPTITGSGRAGGSGVVPRAIAIEPPLAGNPSFTVAVEDGLGSAEAVLVIDDVDPGVGLNIPASGSFARRTITLTASGHGSVSLEIPNAPDVVGKTFYGRWYVRGPMARGRLSVSQLITFTVFGDAGPEPPRQRYVHADFDGDGSTDLSVFREHSGQWFYQRSSNEQNTAFQFGTTGDKIVPADYTGDGKADIAVYRPSSGMWYILRSEDNTFYGLPWGLPDDIPAPGDFDGDGKAEPTVYRPSSGTWYIHRSAEAFDAIRFGGSNDIPQVGDYDGDGKADIAIFRPSGAGGLSEWWISASSEGVWAAAFGSPGDKPVAADYTGDGKTDLAVWRPSEGNWYVLRSESPTYYGLTLGLGSDVPAPGDYDGDGKTDPTVFRPATGVWYILQSGSGLGIFNYGDPNDVPVPGAYVP